MKVKVRWKLTNLKTQRSHNSFLFLPVLTSHHSPKLACQSMMLKDIAHITGRHRRNLMKLHYKTCWDKHTQLLQHHQTSFMLQQLPGGLVSRFQQELVCEKHLPSSQTDLEALNVLLYLAVHQSEQDKSIGAVTNDSTNW